MMRILTRTTSRRKTSRRRGGFTLLEAAITTVIVGVGTVAMLGLLTAGTSANQQAAQLTTAISLANNIHELADQLPFIPTSGTWGLNGNTMTNLLSPGIGNITFLDGQTFNPPIDATNTAISGMNIWSQVVSVHSVDPAHITSNITNSASNPMARVTVTVECNGAPEFSTSWVVAR